MPCSCGSDPMNFLLAGVIIGVVLIIFLSGCGFVKVPSAEKMNVRTDSDPMLPFRGDAPPPVVKGDPFILSMQTGSSGVSPY